MVETQVNSEIWVKVHLAGLLRAFEVQVQHDKNAVFITLMKCRVECLQTFYHRALWSTVLNHAPLEAPFSPLVYPTMAIQSPPCKGPVMDGIGWSANGPYWMVSQFPADP